MCAERIELPRRLIDLKNRVLASRHFWSFTPLPVREYGMFSRFEPIWVQPRPRTAGSAGMRGSGEYSGHVDRLPSPTRATGGAKSQRACSRLEQKRN